MEKGAEVGTNKRDLLSLAEGEDPAAEDVLLLVNSALNSPFAKAAQAVIEAEPQYVRARLIKLAALATAGDEAEVIAG